MPLTRPLFEYYSEMQHALPHVFLGTLPTPVDRLEALEQTLGVSDTRLFVKRDDLSGPPYGGNKVRKLEFLLAHAAQQGYKEVLTFGGAGSNHALATGLYAREMGLKSVSMLVPQPNAHAVRANLLMSLCAGVEMHHSPSMPRVVFDALRELLRHKLRTGRFPYVILPGGTSSRGLIGFVNAAFELREQVENGRLPEPDVIYAASGTMGTVVGLLLGLKAAGLNTRVAAVRVTEAQFSSICKAARLFRGANRLLHRADAKFPMLPFPYDEFQFIHDFYGEAYGLYTPEAMEAIRLFGETTGLHLEGTYTGKTAAALIAEAKAGRLRDKTVLFWNTHNAYDFSTEIAALEYRDLPRPFHRYFEEDVQPLDRRA